MQFEINFSPPGYHSKHELESLNYQDSFLVMKLMAIDPVNSIPFEVGNSCSQTCEDGSVDQLNRSFLPSII